MRAVVKVHKRTREVVGRYGCRKYAADENGLSYSTVSYATGCVSAGEHYWRYEDEFDPDEDLTGKPNCPVVVRNLKTGQTAWYCDVATAAAKLGVSRFSIYQSIRYGRKVRKMLVFAFYGKRIA